MYDTWIIYLWSFFKKDTMRHHFTATSMSIIKKTGNNKCRSRCRETGAFIPAVGDVKWHKCLENIRAVSQKLAQSYDRTQEFNSLSQKNTYGMTPLTWNVPNIRILRDISRFVVGGSWGRNGNDCWRVRGIFPGVVNIDMIVIQLCEYTKNIELFNKERRRKKRRRKRRWRQKRSQKQLSKPPIWPNQCQNKGHY